MLARFILGLKLAARSTSFRSRPPRLAGGLATLPTVGRHWQLSVVNSQRPERWPIGKNNTRRFLLWRFPFAILYSEQESVVTIWAVAHGSRRPQYWERRL
jgi:hypothetical protein